VNSLLTKFQCSDVQLRDAVAVAYEKVLAPHHAPDIWEMAKQCISTLPSRSEILERLNEDGMFFYNFMTTVLFF
jgi:Glycolipid transfer protein (GLTP)